MVKKRISVSGICCLLLSILPLAGCAAGQGTAWREYKVFCGLSSPKGDVSEDAWQQFCDKYVSAAFPDGYTVLDAAGYWRSSPGVTAKERARVILVIAPADAREKVLSVARRFQKDFDQGAVLISISDADMDVVRKEDTNGK